MLNQKTFNRIMFILLVFLTLAVGYCQSSLEARQSQIIQTVGED